MEVLRMYTEWLAWIALLAGPQTADQSSSWSDGRAGAEVTVLPI